MSDKKEIILTGFGSFGSLTSNPTEKLILSLKKRLQDELYQFFVLPVSYSYCSSWSEENISSSTSLVIHFGVSAKSNVIQLERTGHNIIGETNDIEDFRPSDKICEIAPELIKTGLDLESLMQKMNTSGFQCEVSDNAGDYLCNYILYKALSIAKDRSFFVHVPPEEVLSIPDLEKFTLELLRNLQSQVN